MWGCEIVWTHFVCRDKRTSAYFQTRPHTCSRCWWWRCDENKHQVAKVSLNTLWEPRTGWRSAATAIRWKEQTLFLSPWQKRRLDASELWLQVNERTSCPLWLLPFFFTPSVLFSDSYFTFILTLCSLFSFALPPLCSPLLCGLLLRFLFCDYRLVVQNVNTMSMEALLSLKLNTVASIRLTCRHIRKKSNSASILSPQLFLLSDLVVGFGIASCNCRKIKNIKISFVSVKCIACLSLYSCG